jgi:uncharacterized short protein YbdD (DUF466 family)
MTTSTTNTPVSAIVRIIHTIRTMVGVPDYDAYRTHVATHHPECEPLSESAFLEERLEARYSRPGSRCC